MGKAVAPAPSRKVALLEGFFKGVGEYYKTEKEKDLAAQKLDADKFRMMMPFLQTLEKEKGSYARSLADISAKAEEAERGRTQSMTQFMKTFGLKQKGLAQEQTQFEETQKLAFKKFDADLLDIRNKLTIAREGLDSAEAIVEYKADIELALENLRADIDIELTRIDQAFATKERVAGQEFIRGERVDVEAFQTKERIAGEEVAADQAMLDRQHDISLRGTQAEKSALSAYTSMSAQIDGWTKLLASYPGNKTFESYVQTGLNALNEQAKTLPPGTVPSVPTLEILKEPRGPLGIFGTRETPTIVPRTQTTEPAGSIDSVRAKVGLKGAQALGRTKLSAKDKADLKGRGYNDATIAEIDRQLR